MLLNLKLLNKEHIKKQLVFSVKIAVGTCCAIFLAERFQLNFSTSAGTITLLTILSTKWETVRLAVSRIISFMITVALSWLLFGHLDGGWLAYGFFILGLTSISCILGWKNTISVNAVIGIHFLSVHEFGIGSIMNEFYLLIIGISVSIVINLFQNNKTQRALIIQDMRSIEDQLRNILLQISNYLLQKDVYFNILEEAERLEEHLEKSLERACEYEGNTFVSHTEYYIRYIEMRMSQCGLIYVLYQEMNKIAKMPEQAKPLAAYISYLSSYVKEMNIPVEQMERLEKMKDGYRQERLPETREEFESRAVLYHIMMILEDFLVYKKRFVDSLDEKQKRIYWDNAGNLR